MNKKTVALDQQQYKTIISTIRSGFVWNNHSFKPNERLATILVLQANLGLRISDILQLHIKDIIKDGSRYRLDICRAKDRQSQNIYRYT